MVQIMKVQVVRDVADDFVRKSGSQEKTREGMIELRF